MKYPLLSFIALGTVVAGCGKDPAPTATPADATASVSGPATDPGSAAAEGPAEPDESDGEPAPTNEGDEISADDLPKDAGQITDEYGAVAVSANPRAEVTSTEKWAKVKLEIKSNGGKVHKNAGQVLRWDELTRIEFDFEGITHTFLLDLGKDGTKASVKLTYLAGGEEVVRNYGFDAKLKKREVLRLDDGTAVALTISPKTITPLPQEEREKLQGATGDRDPLSGAGQKN